MKSGFFPIFVTKFEITGYFQFKFRELQQLLFQWTLRHQTLANVSVVQENACAKVTWSPSDPSATQVVPTGAKLAKIVWYDTPKDDLGYFYNPPQANDKRVDVLDDKHNLLVYEF